MRAIKKIVALATGATMLGATVMGAMAADLATYPAPFVDGCSFSGAIVVGDSAAAEDVIGAVDISSTLAVSGTTTDSSGTGTTVTVTGEAAKIETDTKYLTLGSSRDALGGEVRTVDLSNDDMATVLADGTFTNKEGTEYDYEQTIRFADDVLFQHLADSDYKNKEPNLMVYRNKNVLLLNYTLDFTKDASSDCVAAVLDDFQDKSIEILGNTYDITTATNTSTNFQLVLMGGAVRDVMEQGQIKTFTLNDKEYEVEVTYIGTVSSTSKTKLKVNGEVTDLLVEDQTYKLADGTTIGIREIMEEEAGEVTADQVEFYLGAEKLELLDTAYTTQTSGTKSGNAAKMNDEDVEGLFFDLVASADSANNELDFDKIIITWIPDDEVFVTEESSATIPGLESFKLTYEGFTMPLEEEIKIENNGDTEIELTAPIKSGMASFSILAFNTTNMTGIGGADSDEGLATVNGSGRTLSYDATFNEYFVASDSGAEESYLLEVTDVDQQYGADFKDVVSGAKYEDKKNGTTFSIGGVTLTVNQVNETSDNLSITAAATGYFDRVFTAGGLTIMLPVNASMSFGGGVAEQVLVGATNINYGVNITQNMQGGNPTYNVVMFEEDRNEGLTSGYGAGVNFNATVGLTSAKAAVTAITTTPLSNAATYEIGDTNEFVGYVASDLGTKILHDQDPDQDTVTIIYHGGESYANVYVAETEAGFGKSEGGAGTTVCKVSVPPALLASEVSNVGAQNLLLVGGPCANTATASVMGVASSVPECLAGFEEGKAMIKLYDTGAGKVAMLVAGMTALDTRRASRVLKDYSSYDMSGDEVEVTGTSLSDISVSAATTE